MCRHVLRGRLYVGQTWHCPCHVARHWQADNDTNLMQPRKSFLQNGKTKSTKKDFLKTDINSKVGTDGRYYSHHTNGWVTNPGALLVSRAGDRVAAIISTDQGQDRGFYPHLVIFRLWKLLMKTCYHRIPICINEIMVLRTLISSSRDIPDV